MKNCWFIGKNMKRKTGKFFLLFVLASLAFPGCFSSWKGDEATITLLLGNTDGGGQRTIASDDEILSYLVHIIELDGPTGRQSHTVKSDKPFSVTVMPGYWHISVRALLNTTLYAQGENGAEIKAGKNNQVKIDMKPLIKDNLIFVTNNLDYYSDLTNMPDAPIPGSLRYALKDIPLDEGNITIMVILPRGSEIKLKSNLYFNANTNITIEGNGIILSKSDEWDDSVDYKRLMNIWSGQKNDAEVTIRRVHFKDSEGGAIENWVTLNLESCIFSNNNSPNGGAIQNIREGILSVKGCTFYGNSADDSGGTIYNENGVIEKLTGNLFSNNKAKYWPVIENSAVAGGGVSSCYYNAVDVELGIDENKSGWKPGLGDKSFATGIQLIDKNFKPVPALNSIVPKDLIDFPTTDFYGNKRTSGAPGAVN